MPTKTPVLRPHAANIQWVQVKLIKLMPKNTPL
jgi:hypothetical protein